MKKPSKQAGAEDSDSTSRKVNPKWKWHYRVLLGLRDHLLQARSGQLHEAAEPLEFRAVDAAESAEDESNHDLILGNLSAEQDALYEVEEALRRIGDDTYGICEVTGKPIEANRLKAVPWTRFCRDAKAKLEKEGVIHRTRLGKAASVRKPKSDMMQRNGIPGQDMEEGRDPDDAEDGNP